MAYIVRENDFANFELVNAETDEVLAHGSHPQDLCELADWLQHIQERDLAAVSFNGEPFGDIRL